MNSHSNRKGKLALRKQTLRRLTMLSLDDMRRVAGGTRIASDAVAESGQCTLIDKTGRSATGSANCRGADDANF